MKNYFLLAFALVALNLSATAQTATPGEMAPAGASSPVNVAPDGLPAVQDPNGPLFKWDEESHDFGEIPQGTPATTRYYFTNVGKSPLLITEAKPTCGCTTPDWTREEIAPGKKGYVEATYNAANPGGFQKNVTVISNASPTPVSLTLKGSVIPKEPVVDPNAAPVNAAPVPVQQAPTPNH